LQVAAGLGVVAEPDLVRQAPPVRLQVLPQALWERPAAQQEPVSARQQVPRTAPTELWGPRLAEADAAAKRRLSSPAPLRRTFPRAR
jgi:hypothetical protein